MFSDHCRVKLEIIKGKYTVEMSELVSKRIDFHDLASESHMKQIFKRRHLQTPPLPWRGIKVTLTREQVGWDILKYMDDRHSNYNHS